LLARCGDIQCLTGVNWHQRLWQNGGAPVPAV
jgi:hypothetical protein